MIYLSLSPNILSRLQLESSITATLQNISDINNRIRNENAPIHQQQLAENQTILADLQTKLSNLPIEPQSLASDLANQIAALRNKALGIPSGFANSGSAARREADNNINLRAELNTLADKLQSQLEGILSQKPQNITPDDIPAISPTNQNIIPNSTGINPLLILGGIALIALTVLKK